LPEAMEKNYKEHDCICEFTGFSQKHFPDELIKVEYVLEANRNNSSLIFAKYYTTYKDMKEIRDNYLSKDDLKEEKIENKIIEDNDELKEEKEKEKKEEKDEDNNDDNDDSEKYITSKVLDINKIENDEDKIIKELIKTQRNSFSKNRE
jgi:alpha-galactosidase/6-phospho-beta-glucosidase family protein